MQLLCVVSKGTTVNVWRKKNYKCRRALSTEIIATRTDNGGTTEKFRYPEVC